MIRTASSAKRRVFVSAVIPQRSACAIRPANSAWRKSAGCVSFGREREVSCINLFVWAATGMAAASRAGDPLRRDKGAPIGGTGFPDIGSLAPWVSLGNYIALGVA